MDLEEVMINLCTDCNPIKKSVKGQDVECKNMKCVNLYMLEIFWLVREF